MNFKTAHQPHKGFRYHIWILCAFIWCSHAFPAPAKAQVPDRTDQRPIKIAYCNYMPFYFEGKNQKPRGILVDIWKKWSLKTGMPVKFVLLSWEETMEKTASGGIDISALMYRTREREKTYSFSLPVMNLSTFLYTRKDAFSSQPSHPVKRLEDIRQLTVGVVAKDFTRFYLDNQLPGLNPIVFKDHEELIKAAVKNDIQAFLMEGPVASTYIAKHNAADTLVRETDPVYTKPLFAGVKQGRTELLNKINQGIELIQAEETAQIIQNWTGGGEPLLFQPRTGKVKIAASIDNMPFHFADENGNAVGHFIDLWKLWAKKTGLEVEFITAPWAESLDMIKSGRADIHAGCFFSVQRDRFLDYAGVLSNCETHFFFHESIFGLKSLEDLKGFQIGILDQDYAVEFVGRELPGAAIKKYNSHQELFDGVAKGEVRVFICDTPTALYFLEKLNLLQTYRYHPATPLYRKPFYSAVKDGNTALVAQINKGLQSITPEERAAIERKWMGTTGLSGDDGLIVAVAQSYPPFSMLNAEGRPSGLLIDLWQKWSLKTNRPVAFRLYDRNSAVNALKDGIVDVISFLPPMASIRGWTQICTPFYRMNWYEYHHENTRTQQTDTGQRGSVVGVVRGSRASEWLMKNRTGNKIKTFESTRQMLLAAASGNIDSFLALPQEMSVLPDRLGLPGAFIQSRDPVFQQQLGGVVRNFNPELIRQIDDGFEAFELEERIEIESRWIRDHASRVFHPGADRILLTRAEKKWLARHNESNTPIRIGIDPEWPPFEFLDSDQSYKGMVSDYVNLLNKRLGLNMTLVETLIREPGLNKTGFGQLDVIPSALSFEPGTPDRIRTRAYLKFPWVIINKQQDPLIGGLRDLHGRTLAVIGRYAIKEQIRQLHPEIHILEVAATRQGLEAVLSGNAHGYIENLAVAGYQLQAQHHTGLKIASSTDFSETGLVFSIRKDWPVLASIMNKGIDSISDQEHDQIRQKWFSVRFEHQVDAAYMREMFLKIGAAALILAGIFSFWNWHIRKRKEAAEAANLSKTKFLASLSHEIRTPLNAILGMTEMTLRAPIADQHKKNLTVVKDSALHLLDVITDILDFSTIEAGRMRIQNQIFCLNKLLSSIESTWEFLAREKGLWFNLSTDARLPEFVKADPVRLQQILGNLVSNAVKFTHKGGVYVTVKPGFFRHDKQDDPNFVSLVFKIEDTGIGIRRDQIDTIFERFTQAETSVTRNYGGTGLGLSICREAARLMGGTLTVKSRPGKGSRFYLKLPLEKASTGNVTDTDLCPGRLPQPSNLRSDSAVLESDSFTLLLADDDPVNAKVFDAFMTDTGYTVIHADDGKQAIDLLRENNVDMVFMDIEMPRMDGITACSAIRKGAAGQTKSAIPIIALSAHVLEPFEQRSIEAGMNAFLAKPVDIDHLFSLINKFMNQPEQLSQKHQILADTCSRNERHQKNKLSDMLDVEQALASLGDNKKLFKMILDIFIQETPAQLEALSKAVQKNNFVEIARYSHTLKGSAARIFALQQSDEAAMLESLSRERTPGDITTQANELIRHFQDLINQIRAWLENSNSIKQDLK